MSVFGRPGNARRAGPGSKVMSRVSMASAAWAWRASAGLVATVTRAITCRAGRGMCRTVPWRPVLCCRMAASWLNVRLSGPPSSRTWPRRPGSVTVSSMRAATSAAETKLTGLSPRPNTRIFPEACSGRPMIVAQVSMKAVARTMAQGMPLARSVSSAACLARNSPIGWPGAAPTTETRTNVAPARAAAPMRLALPARSTEAGETPPGPVKPCTAEITVPAPRWRGRGRHRGPPPPPGRPGAGPGPGRGSAPVSPGPARPAAGPAGCRGCRCPRPRRSPFRAGRRPGTDVLAHGLADVRPSRLDRLQVEPGPGKQPVPHAEHDHPGHLGRGAVATGAGHVPLRPHHVGVAAGSQHPGGDVRDEGEDLLPVAPHLVTAGEALGRVGRGLVAVVRGEAAHQGVQIVAAGGRGEPLQQRRAGLGRVFHLGPPSLIHWNVTVT